MDAVVVDTPLFDVVTKKAKSSNALYAFINVTVDYGNLSKSMRRQDLG